MLVKQFFKLICSGVSLRLEGEEKAMQPPAFMEKYMNTPVWTARIDVIRAEIVDDVFCFKISLFKEAAI